MDRNIIASHPPFTWTLPSYYWLWLFKFKAIHCYYVGLGSNGSWAMGQGTLPKSGTTQAQVVNHSQWTCTCTYTTDSHV